MSTRKASTNLRIYAVLENVFYPEGQLEQLRLADPEKHKFRVEQLERAAKAVNVIFLGDRK